MARARAVIVESDPGLRTMLGADLRAKGVRVLEASDVEQGLALVRRGRVDVALIDIDADHGEGLDLIQRVRAESQIPIVALVARASEEDRERALAHGADDVVTGPFPTPELAERLGAQVRRAAGVADISDLLGSGRVTLDPETRRCRLDGVEIILTAREFDLLATLLEGPARVHTGRQLLDLGWGIGDETLETVDAHVAALGRKLGPAIRITTVHGVGYRIDPAQ